jgi:hypothetical protein
MRLRGRTDANQAIVIKDLRKLGCTVISTSNLGSGFPDILVGFRGLNWLFEIKDGSKQQSKQRLTDDEKDFHLAWSGQVHVITSAQQAIDIMCFHL